MAPHRQRSFSSSFRPCLALAVAALVCAASTTAQPQLPQPQLPQPQPAAMPNLPAPCPPAQATLSPCLSYFIGNSSSPSAACCAQVKAMFQSQAPCLCAAMAAVPFQLGSTLGQLVPSTCNLPPDACAGASSAPAGSTTTTTTTPAAAAPTTEPTGVDPTAPAGGGQKSVPALVDSAAAGYSAGFSAAAVSISLLVGYLV